MAIYSNEKFSHLKKRLTDPYRQALHIFVISRTFLRRAQDTREQPSLQYMIHPKKSPLSGHYHLDQPQRISAYYREIPAKWTSLKI